ncbi:peptidoglycan-binding domain-containing protein [Arsenicicoccus sp. UBA7492]|uniref:peptidoglycan-binding domain-containing protein n=1 Tax=Arsenicicoccus sp. UBA7492 TaxID=1946057 RepID=UPI00257DEABF|nr:peptidoglycan-binding protein [Arsenicicoccus sp. UBA7492]
MNRSTSSIPPGRGSAAAVATAAVLTLCPAIAGCSSGVEGTEVVQVTRTVTATATGSAAGEPVSAPVTEPAGTPAAGPASTQAVRTGATVSPTSVVVAGAAPAARACSPTLRRYPDLDPGARGPAVEAFQCLLRQQGASLTVDGVYGPVTRQAYDQVARRLGWQAWVPHVEAHVWTLLLSQGPTPRLRRGSTGEAVSRVQRSLAAQDIPVTADGRFGADTERAVRTLQTRLGMTVDGIVGPDTWRVLQSGGGPTD